MSEVFEEAQTRTLIDSDTEHWWFRSKAAFVSSLIRDRVSTDPSDLLVDVGAGAGGVTSLIDWRGGRAVAIDGSKPSALVARQRHSLLAAVALGSQIPLASGIAKVVTLLDVIEHLDRPQDSLLEARRILKQDGRLIVTVPAHHWLWSGADVFLDHRRRYSRPLLKEHLALSGFRPLFISHVFSWLVLPVWVQRRFTGDQERQLGLSQRSPLMDRAASLLTALERELIKRATLPLGTSIVAVAVKDEVSMSL